MNTPYRSLSYPRECPQPTKEEHLLSGELEPANEASAVARIAGEVFWRQTEKAA